MKRTLLACTVSISASLLLVHCASNTPEVSQSITPSSSLGSQAEIPPISKAQDAPTLAAALGTYEGFLNLRMDTDTPIKQPYTIILSQHLDHQSGLRMDRLVLDSDGKAGKIHMESELSYGSIEPSYFALAPESSGDPGAVSGHSFITTIQKVANLSNFPIAIDLVIAVKNGLFFPTQSKIRIMDCGFSSSGSCASTDSAPDVRFGTILGKR